MIHRFTINNTNMVLDVNSGAVHILDEKASRVLSGYDQYGKPIPEKIDVLKKEYGSPVVAEAQAELDGLVSEGLLFTEDPFKKGYKGMETSSVVKALCLHIAHDCNMRCKYCFAGEGDYHSVKSKMPLEVGKKAIDFVIENSGSRRNIEIDFFGGEPLLNLETVKGVVDYARKKEEKNHKHFRFTITTNGILLDEETMHFLNDTMDNIVLSLDGRKEVNDRMRVRKDGSGSYDTIIPKFKKMVSMRKDKDYYVRGTFTAKNLDFSKDAIHMADLGFDQISIEPVVLPDGSGMEIKEEHLETLFSEYEKLAKELSIRREAGCWVNFFHFMLELDGGPCLIRRIRGCGAGTEYLAVTPQGALYPCHQFVNMPEFELGSVDTGIERPELVRSFQRINVYTKKKCQECWARFYCSGGCTFNAWQFQEKLDGVYEIACELQKKRVECALWLKADEFLQRENANNKEKVKNAM